MNSIGKKIQLALMGSISIVAFSALILLLINQVNALQNQHTIQTMTMEYNIISLTDTLVKSYNDIVKNPETKEFRTTYRSTHQEILDTIQTLKQRVYSDESKVLLIGVENTVNQLLNESDIGLKEVDENDFLSFSSHFLQLNKEKDFVRDNTRTLLQKELEYLAGNEKKSEQIYNATLIFSCSIFLLIVFGMIFFARFFAKQLITPLVELSLFAKEIANGNLQNRDKRPLKITQDETGSLTNSIYTMVDKLMHMINAEHSIGEELQRMNTLMIGRELKMVELKEDIEKLKQELKSNH